MTVPAAGMAHTSVGVHYRPAIATISAAMCLDPAHPDTSGEALWNLPSNSRHLEVQGHFDFPALSLDPRTL